MVRLGLIVTAHRSEQGDINGRLFSVEHCRQLNPGTGGPLGNINASDIGIQISNNFPNNSSPADNIFPAIWQVSENSFFFDLQQKYLIVFGRT
jgi:hypothetical protein